MVEPVDDEAAEVVEDGAGDVPVSGAGSLSDASSDNDTASGDGVADRFDRLVENANAEPDGGLDGDGNIDGGPSADNESDPGIGSAGASLEDAAPSKSDLATEGIDGDSGDEAAPAADIPGPMRYSWSSRYDPELILGWNQPFVPYLYKLETFSDNVLVREESVLVSGGVLRGLVQNMSAHLYARDVAVHAGELEYRVPLTVTPGEIVPFMFEYYQGPTEPEMVDFKVSADLSERPDPNRAFWVSPPNSGPYGTWEDLMAVFPNFEGDTPPPTSYMVYLVDWVAPDSHPSIAEAVETGTIDDLRVYLTKLDDDGKVTDVTMRVPYTEVAMFEHEDGSIGWVPTRVDRLPFEGESPVGEWSTRHFEIGFVPGAHGFLVTVGGVDSPEQ